MLMSVLLNKGVHVKKFYIFICEFTFQKKYIVNIPLVAMIVWFS